MFFFSQLTFWPFYFRQNKQNKAKKFFVLEKNVINMHYFAII